MTWNWKKVVVRSHKQKKCQQRTLLHGYKKTKCVLSNIRKERPQTCHSPQEETYKLYLVSQRTKDNSKMFEGWTEQWPPSNTGLNEKRQASYKGTKWNEVEWSLKRNYLVVHKSKRWGLLWKSAKIWNLHILWCSKINRNICNILSHGIVRRMKRDNPVGTRPKMNVFCARSKLICSSK